MTIPSEKHHDYTNHNNSNNGGQLSANTNNEVVLFTEDEFEVSNILLDLSFLIHKSLSSHRFAYNWATKKPRSALLSPPLKRTKEASSPTTPLSFSPTHSDVKSIRHKKRKSQSFYSRKEELEGTVKERIDTQQQLKDSIEKVKLYRNKLIVENSELKAKKQKLLLVKLSDERERRKTATTACPQMQPLLQLQTTPVIDLVHAGSSTNSEYHNQAPLIFHQISGVNDSKYEVGPSTSTQFQQQHPHHHHQNPVVISDPTQLNHPPPLIPHQQYAFMPKQADDDIHRQRQNYQFDLNVVPVDNFTTMMTHQMNVKAMAAAARQRRIHANKERRARVKT